MIGDRPACSTATMRHTPSPRVELFCGLYRTRVARRHRTAPPFSSHRPNGEARAHHSSVSANSVHIEAVRAASLGGRCDDSAWRQGRWARTYRTALYMATLSLYFGAMHNELAGGRVTLADVAQLAGVSSKTVSNVVHNYPHVSSDLRTRVKAAIDELGYRPNLTARQLVTGKTGMIALAIPWIDQPYFSELSKFIGEEASRQGYRIIYEQTANSEEAELAVLRDRERGLVDGVIFHPVMIDTLEIARLRPGTPVVLLGESARPLTTDHVMIDNVRAAREGVELLLSQGRRRIAFQIGRAHV